MSSSKLGISTKRSWPSLPAQMEISKSRSIFFGFGTLASSSSSSSSPVTWGSSESGSYELSISSNRGRPRSEEAAGYLDFCSKSVEMFAGFALLKAAFVFLSSFVRSKLTFLFSFGLEASGVFELDMVLYYEGAWLCAWGSRPLSGLAWNRTF